MITQRNSYAKTADASFCVSAYPNETEPSILEKRASVNGENREVLRVTVSGDAAAVRAAFYNGVSWYLSEPSETEGGAPIDYPMDDFCIAGDVVDHRDGRVTFYMAKKTETERLLAAAEEENARLLYEKLTDSAFDAE